MIQIKSNYNVDEIISSLAKEFDAKIIKDCIECQLYFNSDNGECKISALKFNNGVSLFSINGAVSDDIKIEFDINVMPQLLFSFNISGLASYQFPTGDFKLSKFEGSISVVSKSNQNALLIPNGEKVKFVLMVINRAEFFSNIDCLSEELPKELSEIFMDDKAEKDFKYKSYYNVPSSSCLTDILNNKYENLSRTIFLESAALELLSNQLRQFENEYSPSARKTNIQKKDVQIFEKAKKLLENRIKNPPTIKELSKELGINETKLKTGFKKLFGLPIKSWLREKRLSTSKILLSKANLSIEEIAEAVGYKHTGHFAKRFEEKYGFLPKDFRKQVKN